MTDRWTYAGGKIFDGDGILLAHVVYDPQTDFRRNCRMMAAAPEMYIALQNVRVELDSYPHCPFCGSVHGEGHEKDCIGYEVEAAIKKAGGEE